MSCSRIFPHFTLHSLILTQNLQFSVDRLSDRSTGSCAGCSACTCRSSSKTCSTPWQYLWKESISIWQYWFVFEMSKENIMFTCTLSCKPASASPPLLPTWARADCWGFILSGALAEIFVVNKNSNFRTCGIGRGVCWPFGWELSSNIDEPVS